MGTLFADRYNLVRRIGKGGFGEVWFAVDEQLKRDVALKRLNVSDSSGSTSARTNERFRREAIATAKIEHTNVVTIYDVGTNPDKDEIFLVMELLEGRSVLEELSLYGPMAPARALARFIEALDGLQAAHEAGVVHKDLKPANLFLHRADDPREQTKVIDFGIARMESLTKLTGTGRMAGSPRYLAPEYIMGESVTPAIDVYQIALILTEAICGQPCVPRHLEFFDICQRHILNELEFPRPLRDSPLGPILERATARDPAERFGSARELADALRDVDVDAIPQYQGQPTQQLAMPDFDSTMSESAPAVTAMIEQLREQEANPADATATSRYAGSHPRRAGADPQQEGVFPVQSVPSSNGDPSESLLFAGVVGFAIIALVLLGGTLLMRQVAPAAPAASAPGSSIEQCRANCLRWYEAPRQRFRCRNLCAAGTSLNGPPFPAEEAEPQPPTPQ